MASKEVRAALREPFSAEQVLQRPGAGTKLDYVPIQTMIGRVIDATKDEDIGYAWQLAYVQTDFESGTVIVGGHIIIGGDSGFGIGVGKNKGDLDMAAKTANSEAFKNALKNGFGTGLELWDADHRAELGKARQLLAGNPGALKQRVWDIAKEKLGKDKPTAKEVADLFGVSPGKLSDTDALKAILEDQGIL